MKKKLFSLVFALAAGFMLLPSMSVAQEKKAETKQVTLKGDLCCAKCELKITEKCANAIEVDRKGKKVVFILEDEGGKATYHGKICQERLKGSVTGVVTKKDGKTTIKPAKDGVKFD